LWFIICNRRHQLSLLNFFELQINVGFFEKQDEAIATMLITIL
jgi:hypothetical protein